MKIKNIEIGGYIQAKKGRKKLIAGHCYRAVDKHTHDNTVKILAIDDSCGDSLWFCVSDFRKPRPQPQLKPQLKQLDQSIFDGLDEKWRFAAVDEDGAVFAFVLEPARQGIFWGNSNQSKLTRRSGKGAYDASNWQNSLIERDIAKELLEVDLSSELTGSDLCRAMLARGHEYVMCLVGDECEESAKNSEIVRVICSRGADYFDETTEGMWYFAIPINTQGELLTASEVGL